MSLMLIGPVSSLTLNPTWSYITDGSVNAMYPYQDEMAIGSQDQYVYLFTKEGSLRWRYKTEGAVKSVILTGANVIVASGDNKIHFLDRTGTLIWEKELPSFVGYDTALFYTGERIYAGTMDGFLYALAQNGDLRWKRKTDGYIIAVKEVYDRIITVSDKQIYSLALNGTTRRNFNLMGYIRSADISDNYVAVALGDGNLKFFDLRGELLWQRSIGDHVGSIHIGDGIAVGSRDEHLYLFDLNGNIKWKKDLNSSVISVYLAKDHVAAGTLDNSMHVFSRWGLEKGLILQEDMVLKLQVHEDYIWMGAKNGRVSNIAVPRRNFLEPAIAFVVLIIVFILALGHSMRAWR